MIKSALQSSLTNDVKYNSMSVGNLPSSEYLIQSTILSQDEPSVTFDVSGLGSQFKHLVLVANARSTRPTTGDYLAARYNGDSGNNYSAHYLTGNGSTVLSDVDITLSFSQLGRLPGTSIAADVFSAVVVDILDPFNSNKNTVTRGLSGTSASSLTRIELVSSHWRNTAALTSIQIIVNSGSIANKSRLSLYGVV